MPKGNILIGAVLAISILILVGFVMFVFPKLLPMLPSPQLCNSNWQCGNWSVCVNNQQNRICQDGCGNARTENQTCSALKYYGYWGFLQTETADYVNHAFVKMDAGYDPSAEIKALRQQGIKTMLWNPYRAPSDRDAWINVLNYTKSIMDRENLWNDVIVVYLLDEPYYETWNLSSLEWLVSTGKQYFPQTPIMITYYCVSGTTNCYVAGIPSNLDWIGLDPYFKPTSSLANLSMKQKYDETVNPVLNWAKSYNKPIFLIGQSFTKVLDNGEQCWDYGLMPTPEQQAWYYETAKADGRIIGLQWFIYYNYTEVCKNPSGNATGMGAVNYPNILSTQRRWGKEILCSNYWENNPICGSDGKTYTNPDQAKCANVTITRYGNC